MIDLNYYEIQCLKSAIHQMHKTAVRDLDRECRLRICKRSFEFTSEKTNDIFQVTLDIKKIGKKND